MKIKDLKWDVFHSCLIIVNHFFTDTIWSCNANTLSSFKLSGRYENRGASKRSRVDICRINKLEGLEYYLCIYKWKISCTVLTIFSLNVFYQGGNSGSVMIDGGQIKMEQGSSNKPFDQPADTNSWLNCHLLSSIVVYGLQIIQLSLFIMHTILEIRYDPSPPPPPQKKR